MATEPIVIRRYTPPTCSLEIAAQPSPLSQWMGKVAFKDLRFKLSFDDPRISDDAWVVLRGDRAQLEALNTTVSDYVQSFLMQVSPMPAATVEQDIAAQTAIAATEMALSTSSTGIAIQPKGLLAHELILGSLATVQTGTTLTLSSTQLADLSTALDEYSAEATILPSLGQKIPWLPNLTQWSSPNWAGLAAGLLVTIGLGTSLVNGLSHRSTSSETTNQASSSDQRLTIPPAPTTSPTPNPFSTIPPLATLPPSGSILSPGLNPSPSASPNLTGAPAPNRPISAPIIANAPSTTPQPQVKIVDIPQPAAPKVAPPTATASETQPIPPIVDNIGSGIAVEPIPDQRKADTSQTSRSSANDRAAESLAAAPTAVARPAPAANQSFDNPQATAIQRYFQQRWQPPTDLKQGIQYQLELNPNGSLKIAKPLGELAEELRSKAGIPAVGTVLAPPTTDKQPIVVRLLLDPDGSVQALPQ